MSGLAWVILIGLAAGAAVGVQGPLAAIVSQRLGTLESVFIIHLGGAIAALAPLLLMRGGELGRWRELPWYALLAGALGMAAIGGVTYIIPRYGASVAVTLVVAAQLAIGALLDHYGLLGAPLRPMDLSRALGMLVLFVGVWLIVR